MKPWKILVPYDGSNQSDKALKKAAELAELIKKGGINMEISMLYVVSEIYVPSTLFDRDIIIKPTIPGDRLTSQQYLKEFYHKMKSKAKTMLAAKKRKDIGSSNIAVAGSELLSLFGINIFSFMFAGGVLLFILSIELLTHGEWRFSGGTSTSSISGDSGIIPLAHSIEMREPFLDLKLIRLECLVFTPSRYI